MSQPEWKFRVPQESEVNQDPIEGEFFTTHDVGDFADALVRESIQNSLDAKLPAEKKPVTVRYYFSGKTNSISLHIGNHPLFTGIYDHYLASDNGINKQELPDFNSPTEYLVIEDFTTIGLDGSISENDDPKTDSPLGHNFYWFWRNVGRSGKKGSERGKWGLGKTVFPASSTLNTFFGLTNRYDDDKNFLMGLSVLKTHHLNSEPGIKRYPYGYFGMFNHADGHFATPTDRESTIDKFKKTFNLRRQDSKDSGLSVVIPFPRREINSRAVIRSVLRQYFHPIISKNLIVEVIDEDNGIDQQIDNSTIFELLKKVEFPLEYGISADQLVKLFNLCLWSIEQKKDSDFIELSKPPLNNTTMWRRDWFVTGEIERTLQNTIDPFDEGKRIAFKVPVKVQEQGKDPKVCWFSVFLEKDESLIEADSHFVRDGITITGIKKPRNKFIRAMVVIEDKLLVKLLGDAENPAHTEWQKDSSHFRGKYDEGDKVIGFIEKSIDNLTSLLIKPTEGIDKELMKDIFFIELPDEDDDDEPDKDEGEDPDKPKPPKVERKPSPYVVEKKPGGFKLKRNPEVIGFSGGISVSAAYMVVKGSALKRYSLFDFDLAKSPIAISSRAVNNLVYNQNNISFNVSDDTDFLIEVNGFDEDRDLYIKANHYDKEV